MDNYKGFELVEVLSVLIIVICLTVIVLVSSVIRISSLGEGQHTVYITAIEQKGFIFRNYRVYIKTDNSSSQEDIYCMDRSKSALAKKVKEWSKSRKLVEVSFDGVRGIGFGLCQGEQITNIELLN